MDTTITKPKFERHFSGPQNAGLRKAIRVAVAGVHPTCGPRTESAVLGVAQRVALTAQGLATLARVGADYRAAGGNCGAHCGHDTAWALHPRDFHG